VAADGNARRVHHAAPLQLLRAQQAGAPLRLPWTLPGTETDAAAQTQARRQGARLHGRARRGGQLLDVGVVGLCIGAALGHDREPRPVQHRVAARQPQQRRRRLHAAELVLRAPQLARRLLRVRDRVTTRTSQVTCFHRVYSSQCACASFDRPSERPGAAPTASLVPEELCAAALGHMQMEPSSRQARARDLYSRGYAQSRQGSGPSRARW